MTSRSCTECGQASPLECASCHQPLCARHFALHAQKCGHPAFVCRMCGSQNAEQGCYHLFDYGQDLICRACAEALYLVERYQKLPPQQLKVKQNMDVAHMSDAEVLNNIEYILSDAHLIKDPGTREKYENYGIMPADLENYPQMKKYNVDTQRIAQVV